MYSVTRWLKVAHVVVMLKLELNGLAIGFILYIFSLCPYFICTDMRYIFHMRMHCLSLELCQ